MVIERPGAPSAHDQKLESTPLEGGGRVEQFSSWALRPSTDSTIASSWVPYTGSAWSPHVTITRPPQSPYSLADKEEISLHRTSLRIVGQIIDSLQSKA